MPETEDAYATLDLSLRIGEVLLSSGAGAADVTATMLSVAAAGGLRNCEVDVTFTSLTMSTQATSKSLAFTQIRTLRLRSTHYSKLAEVDELVSALVDGRVDRDEARSALASIVSAGPRYPKWAGSISWGLMSVGASLVIGGDALVCLMAFFAAIGIEALQRGLRNERLPAFYQQVAGGFLATAIALGAYAADLAVDPSLVVAASIIMLLSGVAFVGAIQDALTGFYVTAGARGLEATLLTAGIIAGVTGGLELADKLDIGVTFEPTTGGWSQLPALLGGAALAAAAFAFASQGPVRSLLPIAAVGALGELIYRTMVLQDFGDAFASAIAAIVVGVASYAMAGRFRVPPLMVVVAGIVPLLPGLALYNGLFQMADGSTAGLISLATAAAIALGLASGVILGQYIAQPLKREARRLEARLAGPRLVGPFRPRSRRRRTIRRSSREPR